MPAHSLLKLSVLIADDSAFIRESLSSYLLSHAPEIEFIGFAETVPQAIESIRALKPDVAILDIRMPGGSGLDVLSAVKSDRPNPFVIMFTNEAGTHVRNKCLALGADLFFDKSTEFEGLQLALNRMIRERRANEEMEPAVAGT